jgi:hypothetical protein
MSLFAQIEKSISKFIWKQKRHWIAQVFLNKKSKAEYVTVLDFKLYSRAIVTKLA